MHEMIMSPSKVEPATSRAAAIYRDQMDANNRRTDRMFAWLMGFQWVAGIVAAIWLSPLAWEGQSSHIHPHVWAAIFLGGMISSLPIFLAIKRPGSILTRHIIAAAQMFSCGLLIHLTGGRIETHFQYFGALAFLAFYRDWRVLLTASAVVAADHFIRGYYWPESIFGVLAINEWRSLEHTGWILFEDVFLVLAINQSVQVMMAAAERQAELEVLNTTFEQKVEERTSQLRKEMAERGQVEEILRESEKKFRQLAENITDVFWMTSPDGKKMEYVSPAFRLIWGRPIEGLYAEPQLWIETVHPDDRDRVAAAFNELSGSRHDIGIEYRIVRPDGAFRRIHNRGFQVLDANGKVIRLTGIAADITEQKLISRELEENRQLLDSVMKNSVDGIVAYAAMRDADGDLMDFRFLLINPAAERLLGRPAYDLVGHSLLDTSPEIVLDGLFEAFVRIIETGETLDFEYSTVRANTLRWYRVAGVKLGDGLVMSYSDVTDRKGNEESLQLLSSAVEQSKESIIITDADLDLPGPRILFVNPAFTKMTGYSSEEAVGKTPRMLQGPRTDKDLMRQLRQNLGQGKVFQGETINYRKDGKEFYLEWQIAPIRNTDGKTTHFVALQRDVSERKTIEARLFQSQKMETVGKLAGGVAHEFNSILTAILGQSELLVEDLPADGMLGKSAREIRTAANRAANLTRQLLAYGRKQILQPVILDLNRVLADTAGTLEHLMGREVEVKIISALGLHHVKIDPGQMDQVVLCLAMNAVDAMPNGGRLTLETSNVVLDENYVLPFQGLKPGGYVLLAFSDTGVGMTDEVKARAFEPFYSTKKVGEGAGLGLSTCYGIIKQSEGHISVYSEVARGTTIRIYLPQVEQETKSTRLPYKSTDMPHGNETILLAEDDPSLLEMAASLLRRLGYNVLTAVDGVEALMLKNKKDIGHIDLLFTDVVMPHMSGKELSDRIRASYPHIKILFTSAYAENAIVHQGILDEGVALLQKPFTPTALAKKVREVLDGPTPPET